MQKILLDSNIPAIIKQNINTPRISLCLSFKVSEPERTPGVYSLLNRLFMQGTTNRTSEELAQELEENAIELYSEMKHDYVRFKILCLNEDFEHSLEILEDIIFNSHFELFDKEVVKLKGEIIADLDSPRTKALDNYFKTLYQGHFYGYTHTVILDKLDSITREDVLESYRLLIDSAQKNITIVGDIVVDEATNLLNKHFNRLNNSSINKDLFSVPELNSQNIVTIEKEDANQAQIIKGWVFPPVSNKDYPVISIINVILGSSGLSSRLFLELREKQGLAYVVRSSYESSTLAASFSVYIATEPNNINTCLEGFAKEIEKIKTIPVSDEELEGAKNNIIGKRQFILETNSLQANIINLFEMEGLGYDYEDKFVSSIKSVTSKDIIEVANKYFTENYVLSMLAPKKYLFDSKNVIS